MKNNIKKQYLQQCFGISKECFCVCVGHVDPFIITEKLVTKLRNIVKTEVKVKVNVKEEKKIFLVLLLPLLFFCS